MLTARALIDQKRAMIRRNREAIRQALNAAPKPVQLEYIRCRRRIRDFMREHEWNTPVKLAIYPEAGVSQPLSDAEVIWLYQLLSMPGQGWFVLHAKDVSTGAQQIVFQHEPED